MAAITAAALLAAGSAGVPLGGFAAASTIAAAAGTAGTILTGLGAVSGVVGAFQQSNALKQQAKMADVQARISNTQAVEKSNQIQRQLSRDLASANAAFGARGVALGRGGTPENVAKQSRYNASKDIDATLFGGRMESLKYQQDAANLKSKARSTKTFGVMQGIFRGARMAGSFVPSSSPSAASALGGV